MGDKYGSCWKNNLALYNAKYMFTGVLFVCLGKDNEIV